MINKGLRLPAYIRLAADLHGIGTLDLINKGLRLCASDAGCWYAVYIGTLDLINKGLRLIPHNPLQVPPHIGTLDLINKGLRHNSCPILDEGFRSDRNT